MMRAMQALPVALPALRHIAGATRCGCRPDRHVCVWLGTGMALIALVTGILLQILPSITVFPPSHNVPKLPKTTSHCGT